VTVKDASARCRSRIISAGAKAGIELLLILIGSAMTAFDRKTQRHHPAAPPLVPQAHPATLFPGSEEVSERPGHLELVQEPVWGSNLPAVIDLIYKREINRGRVFDPELSLDEAAEGCRAIDDRRATEPWVVVNPRRPRW
jgi:hypothetical protein